MTSTVAELNCVDKRKLTVYDEFMQYVVSEVGEKATDAMSAESAWDAAKVFLSRQVAALGAMFPRDGMIIAVKDEHGRTSTYQAFLKVAP